METFSALILGLVQGLTEFIPVSSSGHLILARKFFGFSDANGLAVDAVLQLATALAVAVQFRREFLALGREAGRVILRRPGDAKTRTLLAAIVLGTIPAVILGLLLEEKMATVFRSATLVAATLLLGSALMALAEFFARQDRPLSVRRGALIGLFQALALVPGLSRSGATISGGLFAGLRRDEAARFSFLLSFPIIAGSGSKKFAELAAAGALVDVGPSLAFAAAVAFLSGLAAIRFLLRFLRAHSLMPFAAYRVALAAIVLVVK